MAAHSDVNLLDSGWDLTADERIAAESRAQEGEKWVGSESFMRNNANEAGSTSAMFNGGKIGATDQFQRPELEIGPYVSAIPIVNKPLEFITSGGNDTPGNCLHGQQVLNTFHLDDNTCGDKSLRVNNTRSEVELNRYSEFSDFNSMTYDRNDVFDTRASENDRSSEQSNSDNYADLFKTEQNEKYPKSQLLSLDMEKDDVTVDFVGRYESVNRSATSDSHQSNSCSSVIGTYLQGECQNESTRNGQSDWHCHNKQSDERDNLARNQLIAVCALCGTFMIGEAVGGVLSNSLALFTDVLHLASDLISFLISLLAIYLSTKPATRTMSFGYYRAEVLGALFSVFIIWLVTGVLCYMAAERIMHKHYVDVKSDEMLVTASLGVVFNIVMGIVLHSEKCCGSAQGKFGHGHSHSHGSPSHRHSHNASVTQDQHEHAYQPLLENGTLHELQSPLDDQEHCQQKRRHKNINVRAAFIHVIGDIIQSVWCLIASLIIKFKPEEEYKLADPICTFLFSVLVILTTVTVFRDTLRVMMEGVPRDLNYSMIVSDLQNIEGVIMVHSLCMWCLTIDKNALSVHLAIDDSLHSQKVLEQASVCLKENHNFFHTTIQVEKFVPALMSNCDKCKGPKC